MVDIQSAAAEIRRGIKKKKIEDRKKPQGNNIMSASATQGGHIEAAKDRRIPDHSTHRAVKLQLSRGRLDHRIDSGRVQNFYRINRCQLENLSGYICAS